MGAVVTVAIAFMGQAPRGESRTGDRDNRQAATAPHGVREFCRLSMDQTAMRIREVEGQLSEVSIICPYCRAAVSAPGMDDVASCSHLAFWEVDPNWEEVAQRVRKGDRVVRIVEPTLAGCEYAFVFRKKAESP